MFSMLQVLPVSTNNPPQLVNIITLHGNESGLQPTGFKPLHLCERDTEESAV